MLILFDLLLVIVLGLLLYTISARDPAARPGLFDSLQLALIVCATWRGRLGWFSASCVAADPAGHIDVHGEPDGLGALVERLESLGATRVREIAKGPAGHWWVMRDPEGNEFCAA